MTALYIVGDVFDKVAELRRRRVRAALVLCSPPFLALRSYLPDGHPLKAREIGSEATPAAFVDVMLALVAECAHVLAPWGSIALELGDTFSDSGGAGGDYDADGLRSGQQRFRQAGGEGWPLAKSLAGIPQAVMLSLAYGYNVLDRRGPDSPAGRWRVRNLKPWIRCLDIDTAVYVRTQTGDRPMRLLHLDQQFAPGKFELWTGDRWTPVVGTQQSRTADALEIEFRTGERVACTRDHRWPVESILGTTKLLRADELTVGDVIPQVRLPGPERTEPPGLPDDDIGWLCGVYLGDGSFDSRDRIQIAGHRILDAERGERLQRIAADYDGTSSVYEHGNEDGGYRGNVVLRSTALAGVIRQYIGGKNARSKHLLPSAWRRSDAFLRALLDGYLASDGHYDEHNDRWRLGFTDNPWLARDLRTIAARLGVSCILKRFRIGRDPRGGNWSGSATHRYRGEIRFAHRTWTPAQRGEIVAIRSTKRTTFIDVAVADDPHLFALASGLLTHNSNPPVGALGDKERPATSYVIVATRSAARYFDLDAVRTAPAPANRRTAKGVESIARTGKSADRDGNWSSLPEQAESTGAPPRDWWHQVDAVLDAELDRLAGKTPAGGNGVGRHRKMHGGTDSDQDMTTGAQTVGARGVHLRRALERAGIRTTVDALDVSPKGYRGAHYAVWPPELVRLLVDEMCPRRVCGVCGQPSRRITGEPTYVNDNGTERTTLDETWRHGRVGLKGDQLGKAGHLTRRAETVGWSDCGHGAWQPGVVLDPFVGSGTTLAVCSGMGRESIGIDLDYTNVALAMGRVGVFLDVEWPEPDWDLLATKALGPGSPHPASYDRWVARTGDAGRRVRHVRGVDDEPGLPRPDVPAEQPAAPVRSKPRAVAAVAGQGDLFANQEA